MCSTPMAEMETECNGNIERCTGPSFLGIVFYHLVHMKLNAIKIVFILLHVLDTSMKCQQKIVSQLQQFLLDRPWLLLDFFFCKTK
ncbi:hypothetical protein CDAR_11441 [Caerostris darwini]|uniref:Uncharacterized protein n=1 Tax=Caerostris darwini TaxID=1538125 RepID=A0AAV4RE61_9ARAC|nr:hypothetical protein CDAR_11441 [Caerostris darwini]